MKSTARIFIFLWVMLFAAHSVSIAGDAGVESPFSIGSGVRALSMGGGFVGMADDASAVYWNQAGLALLEQQEVSSMFTTLLEGTTYGTFTYVYPHPRLGSFGGSIMALGTGEIERREDWIKTGEFSYSIVQLLAAYGRHLGERYYLGTAFKFVNQSIDNNSSLGFGVDLSFYTTLHKNVSAGVIFQDIVPPTLKPGTEKETLPFTIIAGAGAKAVSVHRDVTCNFNFALEKPEERSAKLHAGAEGVYKEAFAVRAGFDRDNLALGFGVRLIGVQFDYSWRFMDEIRDSHRFGLSWRFGKTVSDRRKEEARRADERTGYLIFDDREKQFEFYKDLGDYYQRTETYDSAFIYYHRALAYRENDSLVLEEIGRVTEGMRRDREQEEMENLQSRLNTAILDEYYGRAEILYDEKDYSRSLTLVRMGLDIDPAEARLQSLERRITEAIRGRVGELLKEAALAQKDGRWQDAITTYDEILELSPAQTAAEKLKGRLADTIKVARLIRDGTELFYERNLSMAEEKFKDVLMLAPDNIVAQEFLRQIESEREQPTGREELERDERMWKIYLEGLEFYQKGQYDSAITRWEEVLRFYPDNQQTIENIRQARLRLEPE
jgi:tetratricopeptide (TPR) repeat protein